MFRLIDSRVELKGSMILGLFESVNVVILDLCF